VQMVHVHHTHREHHAYGPDRMVRIRSVRRAGAGNQIGVEADLKISAPESLLELSLLPSRSHSRPTA
jgi:hypothetical protein